MMPESVIQPFGFTLSVPLQKYINAVDPGKNYGRGTIPDHEVVPALEDVIQKRDVETGYTIQLINKNK